MNIQNARRMKIPNWTVPFLLRFLSLLGSSSAGAGDRAQALTIGLSLGPATFPTESLSQPRRNEELSLNLDFFVNVANHELKIPIMPL